MTSRTEPARIGLFGGTFNPIHLGHLRAAEEVADTLGLAKVLFIPSSIPPHKQSDAANPIASASERLEWTETAIADVPHFEIERIEIEREGPSFLVDTLEALGKRELDQKLVFIVGEDAFAEMGEWRAPERIFALADFAVMTRPPGRLEDLAKRIPDCVREAFEFSPGGRVAHHRSAGTRIDLVRITALDISSSAIRTRIGQHQSIRFLVPEAVRTSIEASPSYAAMRALSESRRNERPTAHQESS